ncbi:SusD/RagB family nutrient-binding outer membrane lipoprotein [Paraflavitalea speifideaquila]|uniref:SusD/RagB family nutrient-binding outer membrane lipoprotein n=1 Tax=Paraflavitalea speifideaquila TaxID=3076558 RepID=UPI0028E36B22|nr:SusD/RagB family nutrient-binding outer membrane lipoprotein [Paraflavitalea speifideiaquila]
MEATGQYIETEIEDQGFQKHRFSGNPTFSADGFLTEDAIVNPGYAKVAGQQNPFWNTYHSSATGSQAGSGRSRIPTYWIVTFYDGSKIDDEGRRNVIFRGFKNGFYPPRNQLGVTSSGIQSAPTDNTSWYTENLNYANSTNSVGVLKGPAMGQPLLLAAESYLLQAEAVEKGLITGNAKSLFNKGIEASFTYLYKGPDNKVAAGLNPVMDAANYLAVNSTSKLVNYDLALTPAEKLEAIITQKYIAFNMIDGREAWAEFRRTGYPTINNALPLNQYNTFVSTVSASTAPDRLPGRILYPNNEFQVNPDNVPRGVNTFTSYVFWDRRK